MGRNAVEVADLVNTHAQCNPYFGVQAARVRVQIDQMIELELIAQTTEYDFGGQSRVSMFERGGVREEQVGGIRTCFDTAQNIEGDGSGRADTCAASRHYSAVTALQQPPPWHGDR